MSSTTIKFFEFLRVQKVYKGNRRFLQTCVFVFGKYFLVLFGTRKKFLENMK